MPRIKHVFSQGKMNKDLDERLVPNGEYREAMNIEVSTSEDDGVGAVRSLQGNHSLQGKYSDKIYQGDKPVCIGSIADGQNDSFYWLTTGTGTTNRVFRDTGTVNTAQQPIFEINPPPTDEYGAKGFTAKSVIFRSQNDGALTVDTVIPVFVDLYEISRIDFTLDIGVLTDQIILDSIEDAEQIIPGMLVEAQEVRPNGITYNYFPDYMFVKDVDVANKTITLSHEILLTVTSPYPGPQVLIFKRDPVLKFSQNRLITALNIIDDMMLWTDDYSEPKKINITRSILGTEAHGDQHTILIVNETEVMPIEERHVVVVRPAPENQLNIEPIRDGRTGVIDSTTTIDFVPGESQHVNVTLASSSAPNYSVGDTLLLASTTSPPPSPLPDGYHLRARVVKIWSSTSTSLKVKLLLLHKDSLTPTYQGTFDVLLEEETESLFELKFVRFAYRYKFADGEYSPASPFTDIVFNPGRYHYAPNEAYNKGMVNNIKELKLSNFTTLPDMPEDVVQIDILYKEEISPNIYSIDSLKPNDPLDSNSENPWSLDEYVVTSENIYAALPPDQSLRHWDAVPKMSKSQEIVANRLIYANYVRGHDMLDVSGDSVKPMVVGSYEPRYGDWDTLIDTTIGRRSLKSIRTYKLGVAYIDDYGRQTPVFTNTEASITIPKTESLSANILSTSIDSQPPEWARSYKIFVKETTNDYYNLSVDRVYEAKDDNVWLSFPSAERSKLDEETYLIFKKKPGDATETGAVLENARYKVIAIDNEAPQYVKTEMRSIGTANGYPDNIGDLFKPGSPFDQFHPNTFNTKTIVFTQAAWAGDGGAGETTMVEESRYIVFRNKVTGAQTEKYTIETCSTIELIDSSSVAHICYQLVLDKGLTQQDVDFLTNNGTDSFDSDGDGIDDLFFTQHLEIEIWKEIVENKPEFDGRFFVKIRRDNLIETYLESIMVGTNVDDVVAQIPTYYFADKWAPEWQYGGGTYLGSSCIPNKFAGMVVTGPTASYTMTETALYTNGHTTASDHNHWVSHRSGDWDILTTNLGGQGWFIDQAFYATKGSPGRNPNGGPGMAALNGTMGGNVTWRHGMGFGRGIYSLSSTRAIMELSYVGIPVLPDGNINFNVGDAVNPATQGQNSVTSRLHEGSKFKWVDDPSGTVYTIVRQPSTESRFCHTSGYESLYPNILSDHAISYSTSYIFLGLGGFLARGAMKAEVAYRLTARGLGIWTSEFIPMWIGENPYPNKINPLYVDPDYPENRSIHAFNAVNGGYAARQYFQDTVSYTWPSTSMTVHNGTAWSVGDPALDQGATTMSYNHGTIQNPQYQYHTIQDAGLAAAANEDIFRSPTNFRRTWRLTIEPNPLNNPSYDVLGANCNSTTPSTIQFLQQAKSYSDQEQSTSPAVFETEPKTDTDLDIYYEISRQYPLVINPDTNHWFAPLNNITECETLEQMTGLSKLINSGSGTRVSRAILTEWSDSCVTLTSPVNPFHAIELDDAISADGDVFKFTHPDGSYTTARLNYNSTFTSGSPSQTICFHRDVSQGRIGLGWYNCISFNNGVESDRIRDDFNAPTITNGAKASTISLKQYKEERRKSGLIFSGIYNSKSGLNSLNQFIENNNITKDLNPTYGSVQKLYTRNTDLVALCEDRVLRILANKDALYNADGNVNLISKEAVLGQAVPFAGEYGISKNPESFASEAYRAYFTDKQRGAVLRLSMDGLTPVSDYGMKSYFNKNLRVGDRILGSFDEQKGEYNLTIMPFEDLFEDEYSGITDWRDVPAPGEPSQQA